MKFRRRHFLRLAGAAAAAPAVSRFARAANYPIRPVRILVGFSAGGAVDIVARLIGQWLSQRLGAQFIVEDRPGAANNIATEDMIRSASDGYTLLLTNPTNAINATLYPNLKYNFLHDSDPVAGIMRVPDVMAVGSQVPAKTVPEFIAYAKANVGKVYYASPGTGTSVMMSAELFKIMAPVELLSVTYRGMNGGGYTDMLSGRVQVAFDNLPGSIGYIRNGQFRALGVTTTARSEALPDVPSISEFIPGYEASAWYGLSAPKGTPAEVVETLNREVNLALADPEMRRRLVDLGGTMLAGSPADFGKLTRDETEKWAKVVQAANIKID
ncbi:MAG TPA: tripartite tricarboxylate transporter substrate binding protein [Xanthobacteraceae bacterium]